MGGVNLVGGFRPDVWREALPDDGPADLAGFNEDVAGIDGVVMPATQHDAVFWLSVRAYDVIFDVARTDRGALGRRLARRGVSSWPYRHDDLVPSVEGLRRAGSVN